MVHIDHPMRVIECYCASCARAENRPTRHTHVSDNRLRISTGEGRLDVYHTNNEDSALVIRLGDTYMVLDQNDAIRLAAFLDFEFFGQEGFE